MTPTDRAICWGYALHQPLRRISTLLARLPGCTRLSKSGLPDRYRRACLVLAYHRNAAGLAVDVETERSTQEKMARVELYCRTGQIGRMVSLR